MLTAVAMVRAGERALMQIGQSRSLWLGPIWAFGYYMIFRGVIARFNLKTPGREAETEALATAGDTGATGEMAHDLVLAFGGRANIKSLDACITRLRVDLHDIKKASPEQLKGWVPPVCW